MNRLPPYRSPELLPPAALAEVTAKYKAHNDARQTRLDAGARIVLRTSAGLDTQSEEARRQILDLIAQGRRAEADPEWTLEMRLDYHRALSEAMWEFCTALGATTSARRGTHLDAMHEAIASLDAYRGVAR